MIHQSKGLNSYYKIHYGPSLEIASNYKQYLEWEIGSTPKKEVLPKNFYHAKVPGAVQLDLANALNYGPYYYAENWKDYLWMEDQYFVYKTCFSKPELSSGEKCYFISYGIDYQYDIFVNNHLLFSGEGMFSIIRIDITDDLLETNELKVVVYPVPKIHNQSQDRTQAAQCVKPAVSYGWDWHPRIIPQGIWDDTFMLVQKQEFNLLVETSYQLDVEKKTATLFFNIEGNYTTGSYLNYCLSNKSSKTLKSGVFNLNPNNNKLIINLDEIELWWPYDQGIPALYDIDIELISMSGQCLGKTSGKIGFREVKMLMNEGAWNEPVDFPKSQSVDPIQIQINGKKIFAKGTNWVNPEIFPGTINFERYQELLDRAVEANLNILRVWGGGIVNKESFYSLCDEKGLMVWQEFPLACNNYYDSPEYLKILEQESESIIKKIRKHASLLLWCGGNELFNSWSGMTMQSIAIRMLNSQCLKFDPATPFIPTSPMMGMGHGHYVFRDWQTGEEVFSWMNRARNTAYTEFGVPGSASLETLERIIPSNELWPPKPGTSWESHHAFNAWVGNTWLMPEMLEHYFGKAKNLEELVDNGQLIQSEGYKAIYEEARRQKPYCSMVLNWCFNEPWPTAANNSIVSWPNIPKPAFYAVKNSCRPILASARLKKLQYSEGETFEADIWMLNDSPQTIPKGIVNIKIIAASFEHKLLSWEYESMQANTNIIGPRVRFVLPHLNAHKFKLILEAKDQPQYNSEYTLLYKPLVVKEKNNLMNL